jgi:hypothetical protein
MVPHERSWTRRQRPSKMIWRGFCLVSAPFQPPNLLQPFNLISVHGFIHATRLIHLLQPRPMPTAAVIFAIELVERSDPDLDDSKPNHYAFAIGAIDVPRRAPNASRLVPEFASATLASFEAALAASNATTGNDIDLSMSEAVILDTPGIEPFFALTLLAESDLPLDRREAWTQRHFFSAAQAALGAPVVDLAQFFPQSPAERAAAIDAWSSLCMDPTWAKRRPPPPVEPFLLAFSQWEALALKAALGRSVASPEQSASAPSVLQELPKRPPKSL